MVTRQPELFGNDVRKGQLKLEQPINKSPWKGKEEELETNLRHLIAYNSQPHVFTSEEDVKQLIHAIDNVKILDPACGSGAFPMGILHKLVHVLHKLDPKNELWKQRQIDKASQIDDAPGRDAAINTIEEAFENNELDYGRKLYLIENCIYGVDIQPIAVQICKLRFFISLIVDQKVKPQYAQALKSGKSVNPANHGADNLGIRPLPNLETKFVAANTLIALEKENANLFTHPEIEKKKEQLKKIRHDYFEARTPKRKENCRSKDKQLRNELAELLVKNHDLQPATAKKVVAWNPYDQNASASFFDMEWMFGLKAGFDVVIGNPPYVDIKALSNEDVKLYFRLFKTTENRINLYSIFIEKGIDFLNQFGILVYINPNSILINESYKKIRKFIVDGVERILKLPDSVFEAATVETIILMTRKKSFNENVLGVYFGKNDLIDFTKLQFNFFKRSIWKNDTNTRFSIFSNEKATRLLKDIEVKSEPLKNFLSTSLGITPYDKYKGHSEQLIANREYHSKKKLSSQYVPLISGKNIHHFYITNEVKEYLKYGDWLGAPRDRKFFEKPKIIVRQILSGDKLRIVAGFSEIPHYFTQIGFSLISKTGNKEDLKFIVCLLNSTLLSFYHKNKFLDTQKAVFQKILIVNCKLLPIKTSYQKDKFAVLVDYILLLKKNNQASVFFECLIDAMVYELYLPEAIQAAGCQVLKHLHDLPEITEGNDEKNLKIIDKVYQELSGAKHPVGVAMDKMQKVEEIKIIEGK